MTIVQLESLNISKDLQKKYQDYFKSLGHELIIYEKSEDVNELKRRVKDAEVLIITNSPLSNEVLDSAPNLKYVDIAFTGINHVDRDYLLKRNILVSNAKGYATTAVKELWFGLVFNLLRFIKEGENHTRNGEIFSTYQGSLLSGKTVGIIGLGAIGLSIAKALEVFNVQVITYNRNIKKVKGIEDVTLEELLKRSDIVSLSLPLNNSTYHLLDKTKLSLLKPSSYLINLARGEIIDEKALYDLLINNKIKGAALDVYSSEPPLDINNPLLKTTNTILTPHIAYNSIESMEDRAKIVYDNLDNYLNNTPINLV
ncbi:MAG TPA: NAD(P)-dependent oxidoreductase [Candidatus Onthovivens sp.]|nr:NAD(P)-dependent oxidoreductase [Candidatus Onthovivens sp.]